MDSARPSTGVKSKMRSVAAALLHSLQLLRPRLLNITAVALPGEITFACTKIGLAGVLDLIVATRNRCSQEAYVFFRDSLDYTTKQQKKTKGAPAITLSHGLSTDSPSAAKRQPKENHE